MLYILLILLMFVIILLIKRIVFLHNLTKALLTEVHSLRTSHGKTIEQLFPFSYKYKYNPKNFRFLGSPIDGVQFESNKIIFVEFKSGNSKLTSEQKRIKKLVNKKKVFFEEFRT